MKLGAVAFMGVHDMGQGGVLHLVSERGAVLIELQYEHPRLIGRECSAAQYPRRTGRKAVRAGQTLMAISTTTLQAT